MPIERVVFIYRNWRRIAWWFVTWMEDSVLRDLSAMWFDAEWCTLGASSFGAIHRRKRFWLLATDANRIRRKENAFLKRSNDECKIWSFEEFASKEFLCPIWQGNHPGNVFLDDRFPRSMDQFRAVGNAQVPIVAAKAFEILYNRIMCE